MRPKPLTLSLSPTEIAAVHLECNDRGFKTATAFVQDVALNVGTARPAVVPRWDRLVSPKHVSLRLRLALLEPYEKAGERTHATSFVVRTAIDEHRKHFSTRPDPAMCKRKRVPVGAGGSSEIVGYALDGDRLGYVNGLAASAGLTRAGALTRILEWFEPQLVSYEWPPRLQTNQGKFTVELNEAESTALRSYTALLDMAGDEGYVLASAVRLEVQGVVPTQVTHRQWVSDVIDESLATRVRLMSPQLATAATAAAAELLAESPSVDLVDLQASAQSRIECPRPNVRLHWGMAAGEVQQLSELAALLKVPRRAVLEVAMELWLVREAVRAPRRPFEAVAALYEELASVRAARTQALENLLKQADCGAVNEVLTSFDLLSAQPEIEATKRLRTAERAVLDPLIETREGRSDLFAEFGKPGRSEVETSAWLARVSAVVASNGMTAYGLHTDSSLEILEGRIAGGDLRESGVRTAVVAELGA